MKSILLALLILGACPISAGVPPQAQASELAVPRLNARSDFKYAGAVLIVQCKLVYGLLLIDKDGTIEPQHLIKDMPTAKLMELLSQANPQNVWMTETPCASDQVT